MVEAAAGIHVFRSQDELSLSLSLPRRLQVILLTSVDEAVVWPNLIWTALTSTWINFTTLACLNERKSAQLLTVSHFLS